MQQRVRRFAVCGAVLSAASVVGIASPAGARVYAHAPGAARAVPAVAGTLDITPSSLSFPGQRAGTYSGIPKTVT